MEPAVGASSWSQQLAPAVGASSWRPPARRQQSEPEPSQRNLEQLEQEALETLRRWSLEREAAETLQALETMDVELGKWVNFSGVDSSQSRQQLYMSNISITQKFQTIAET